MITKNYLLFISLLISLLQTSHAPNSHICSPSACGVIRNITFPFRLKHDPKHCGYHDYELSCENNVTFLHLNSQKHQVKAINYDEFTIRLVDISINNTNTSPVSSVSPVSPVSPVCSVPNHSAYVFDFPDPYSYQTATIPNTTNRGTLPINYITCPYPLTNPSFLPLPNNCAVGDATRHAYIKVGHMNASQVEHMCRIDLIAMSSWKFEDLNNVSISEIHDSLLYGFELSWYKYPCSECKQRSYCFLLEDHTAICLEDSDYVAIVILVFIIIVVFAGASIPAMVIAGFICVWVFYIAVSKGISATLALSPSPYVLLYIGLAYLGKNIILFPCIIGFFIYKFRRRHLSAYDAIEEFLQSDNKLMPIRYSYSDIKKMTRGFREKLGQGGYGTVYKGKLRSGYDVAVKILGKPGGNGQDFMNEIATIGRIHHVNVVNLVGYCAERSKRALVFDFMPNGSLDKYIFGRENTICLSWERKYEIAVGVARGIEYLHKGCNIQILHFDIKPHNILLDDNFTPKISDFGLAKFYSTDKNMVTMTAVRGTIGYVAPELINRGFGGVSYKADVYSFGMLLIEMIGLKRDLRGNNQTSSKYFPCWIYDCFEQGRDFALGDTEVSNDDDDNDTNKKIAKKMTIVALWCIQMSPCDRPSMNKVLEMMEGDVERLRVPNRPSESAQVAVNDDDESGTTYSTNSTSLLHHDAALRLEITVED